LVGEERGKERIEMVRDADVQFMMAAEAYRTRRMARWDRIAYYRCDYCKHVPLEMFYFSQPEPNSDFLRLKTLCVNCYGMNQFNGLVNNKG
jgi:hypothetical protein